MKVPLTHLVQFDIIMANSWSFLYDEIMSTNEIYEDTLPEFSPSEKETSLYGEDILTFDVNFPTSSVPELPQTPDNNNGRWKYNEDVILKDIHEYVSGTYRSHYTGNVSRFKGTQNYAVQTIDLLEAKGLASDFCQANIIKYGSRYGDKDGQNKKDLLKVIHYAMLLLHFDDHYKPTTSDFPY